MTKHEVVNKTNNLCVTCTHLNTCDKILSNFRKPKSCGGPFEEYDTEQLKRVGSIIVSNGLSQLYNTVELAHYAFLQGTIFIKTGKEPTLIT